MSSKDLSKFHQAAFTYVGLGVVIVLVTTFFVPSHHYRSGFGPLIMGIIVLLVISFFLYKGISWLAKLLCVAACARTGWWMYSYFAFGGEEAAWAYLVNSLLNGFIIYMLARAAWDKRIGGTPSVVGGALS